MFDFKKNKSRTSYIFLIITTLLSFLFFIYQEDKQDKVIKQENQYNKEAYSFLDKSLKNG